MVLISVGMVMLEYDPPQFPWQNGYFFHLMI